MAGGNGVRRRLRQEQNTYLVHRRLDGWLRFAVHNIQPFVLFFVAGSPQELSLGITVLHFFLSKVLQMRINSAFHPTN